MRARFSILLITAAALLLHLPVRAETKLDFWHSYQHQPGGVVHYSFQIASYKRGLFFGSCGPSTRSLQWQFDIDLAGPGPSYRADQILVTSDGKPMPVVDGTVALAPDRKQVTINLRVQQPSGPAAFSGNGSFPIHRLR